MNILCVLIVFHNTDLKLQLFSTKASLIVNWKSRLIAGLLKGKETLCFPEAILD